MYPKQPWLRHGPLLKTILNNVLLKHKCYLLMVECSGISLKGGKYRFRGEQGMQNKYINHIIPTGQMKQGVFWDKMRGRDNAIIQLSSD
jgi:hypothetical protein